MYTLLNKKLVASALGVIGITLSAITLADTVSEDITEARQETQIWTTYALSPYLRSNDLKVSVNDGKATLTGIVDEEVNKDLAKQIALGVTGIKEVDNNIKVQADYNPAQVARSYGEVIDDVSITAAVKSKLLWSKYDDIKALDVETKVGKVVLRGTTNSEAARDHATRLAINTRGVRSVTNQLVVQPAKQGMDDKAKDTVKGMGASIADSWITTKVKSTLLYSSNVVGSDIDVKTEKGVVTLSGKLGSGVERALAIELAQNVHGVKSVEAKSLTF